MNPLELLRAYEPVLRFTNGEMFFPCAVDGYVERCSLLLRSRDPQAPPIVPAGRLSVDRLASEGADASRPLCLRLVEEPLRGRAFRDWLRRSDKPAFRTSGRLARVGLIPRFVDSLFLLSLLLRGTVPGGTAAAAEQQYRADFTRSPGYVYYGRVVRQEGYVALHYLFFYFMNDWRSTFAGVNDHEADWEQVFVYLAEREDGGLEPAWVAYASHDYHGDDLRRRWDDPELAREGTHPVVFPGAGSHSSYFQAGEYLTSVGLPHTRPLLQAVHSVQQFWRDVLRQGEPSFTRQVEGLLRIPFVDYARGDGTAIGPGQPHPWSPVVISDETPWVSDYRGLWGLDTHDPLQGELAPSGPKYDRDGSVRRTWFDPIGWAGLGKVAPPARSSEVLQVRIVELEQELDETDRRLGELAVSLPAAEIEARALRPAGYLSELRQRRERELAAGEAERNTLEARRVELRETLAACRRLLVSLEAGDAGDPQAHLRHKRSPQSPLEIRRSRAAEIWAGLSISILLLGGVAVLILARENWLTALALLVVAVVVVENVLRRSLQRLLLNATVVLALISTGVLIYRFFWTLSLLGVVVIALVILRDNLRGMRGN